jgi:flagellar biosynthesis/type III secretory pathway M-ring protein FliF/YscJ
MGKFDKFNKKKADFRGIFALTLVLFFIIVYIINFIRKYFKKDEDKEINKKEKENNGESGIKGTGHTKSLRRPHNDNSINESESQSEYNYVPKEIKNFFKIKKVPQGLKNQLKELNKKNL